MATPLQFADQILVFQDIGKTLGDNVEIDDLVARSDQDASSYLESVFRNNIDFTNITDGWFTDLATRLTTAIYWWKSNGTTEAEEKIDKLKKEAEATNIKEFFPVEFRS